MSFRKRPRDDYDDSQRFYKRGRYSDPGPRREEQVPTDKKLESFISRIGSAKTTSLDKSLYDLSELIYNELSNFKEKILRTICNCVASLSETTVYSTLVGILNAKKYDFGEELLDMLVEDLKSSLLLQQFDKATCLVRFLADLVNAKVVAASSILNLFDTFVTVTYEPSIPQVRSDIYVYMILSALPWVAHELQGRKQGDLVHLFTALENYMSKRTTPYLPALQVWTTEIPHPQREYLELLWCQLKKMKENNWKEGVLLRPYTAFESDISGAYSHPLPAINVPIHMENSAYPLPHAVFRIFDEENSKSLPPEESIDRYLAEETVCSIVQSHASNRKECAAELEAFVKRTRFSAEYIVVETLFGYVFQLPSSPQVMVYYGSLFIELCKANLATYPQLLTDTTELLFGRLDKMNSICMNRFARWFAYHLSNFNYQWDWNLWVPCLDGPPDHASLRFIVAVFSRCIRLGCYEEFVESIPEKFGAILPPAPSSNYLYKQPSSEEEEEEKDSSPEAPVATTLSEAIRAKESIEKLTTILESVTDVIPDLANDKDKLLSVKVSLLTQCVLNVGSKTVSHCFLALYKFKSLFFEYVKTDESRNKCLQCVADFYTNNPQLLTLVVDKMMRMQIIDCMSVVNWTFSPETLPFLTSQHLWDILESTIQKTSKSYHQASHELADIKEKLQRVSHLDEVALGEENKQELEDKKDELEEKADECDKLQKDLFLAVCHKFISSLTEHVTTCDQQGVDYETAWFVCTLDNFRQLLVQNCSELKRFTTSLESLVFTPDVDSRILEVFHQFQALL